MKRTNFLIGWGLLLLAGGSLGLGSGLAAEIGDPTEGESLFALKVKPLLSEKCFACHSESSGNRKGGLLLDSREAILQGGDSGPAVISGERQ